MLILFRLAGTRQQVLFGCVTFVIGGFVGFGVGWMMSRTKAVPRYMQAVQCFRYAGTEVIGMSLTSQSLDYQPHTFCLLISVTYKLVMLFPTCDYYLLLLFITCLFVAVILYLLLILLCCLYLLLFVYQLYYYYH